MNEADEVTQADLDAAAEFFNNVIVGKSASPTDSPAVLQETYRIYCFHTNDDPPKSFEEWKGVDL